MKRPSTVLDTLAIATATIVAIMLVGEFLIILLLESVRIAILGNGILKKWLFELTASVALYRQIFGPMNAKHAELEWQKHELCCIPKVTVGSELRIKEFAGKIAALRNSLAVVNADNIQLTTDTLEKRTMHQSNPAPSR